MRILIFLLRILKLIWAFLFDAVAMAFFIFLRGISLTQEFMTGKCHELHGPWNLMGKGPVLLLAGLNMDHTCLGFLRRRLVKAGWGPVYMLDLGPFSWTIEEKARHLCDTLKKLAAEHGKIQVIAHSMGGLVTRFAIQELGAKEFISSLACMGTPHFGTPMACLGFSTACKQLYPDSGFLKRLNSNVSDALPKSVRYLSIFTDLDLLVWKSWGGPRQLELAEHIGEFYFIDLLGHMSLLISPRAFHIVETHLEKQRGTQPLPASGFSDKPERCKA